ncbi:MAG TPA: hypothetical protein VN811_10270, partial [Thermoanaerobaculia bacterium]|nr:hypothetical protein [Thermoanaerobaculia bacterium]
MSEIAAVAIVAALLLLARWRAGWIDEVERWFLRVLGSPRASWRWLLGLAVVAFAGQAAVALVAGMPVGRIHDDFSHLLAGDTFAHGRLANPTHPLWRHFETFHVLLQPTYASKYPPATGLALALGELLGHPAIGVWLAGALFCVVATWALGAWLRPAWARLGGVVAAATLVVASPWSWQFSGGFLPAIGGALLFGAAVRLERSTRAAKAAARGADGAWRRSGASWRLGLALGTGLAVLAASRPWEGMAAACVALVPLLWRFVRAREARRRLVRAAGAAILLLATAAGWLAWYQWRVTGSPWTMPYRLYDARYAPIPVFLWQSPRAVEPSPHAVMARFYSEWEHGAWTKQHTPFGWLKTALQKSRRLWRFYIGPLGTLALAGVPWALRRRGPRWAAAGLGVLLLSQLAIVPSRPHYVAPGACLAVYLIVEGWRQLRVWRRGARGAAGARRFGSHLATALLVAFVAVLPLRALALRPEPTEWFVQRAAMQRRLDAMPGHQLVLVRYGPAHEGGAEWVYNDADLFGTRV